MRGAEGVPIGGPVRGALEQHMESPVHAGWRMLAIVDDPVKARDLFASGHSHVLWGTLDMMALFAPELVKDSRTVPVICQQIDWSGGGDGIVARGDIRNINDFRMRNGKRRKVVLAQNSPSHYLIMSLLIDAGSRRGDGARRARVNGPNVWTLGHGA